MKSEDFICIVPSNIDSSALLDIAKKLDEQSRYESFRLGFYDNEFYINGIREETEEEKKLRLASEEKYKQHKVKDRQFIEQILALNPGIEYVNERVELKYGGFAEKLFDDRNARAELAWSMREPSGYFLRDGMRVDWFNLNRPE